MFLGAATRPRTRRPKQKKAPVQTGSDQEHLPRVHPDTLAQEFGEVVRATLVDSSIDVNVPNVVVDAEDPDGQKPAVLVTAEEMIEYLRRHYSRMAGMIISDPPEFDGVTASIAALEKYLDR